MPPMLKPYKPDWSYIGPKFKLYTSKISYYKTVLQTASIDGNRQCVHGDRKSSVEGAVTTWIVIGKDKKLHWAVREGRDANKIVMSGAFDPPKIGTEEEKESLASALLKADIKKKFKEVTGDELKFNGE